MLKRNNGDFTMASMNISLPEKMKEFIEKIARESGEYTNTSDYIRDLVRHDEEKRMKIADLQAHLDEARASGLSERTFDEIINSVKQRHGIEIHETS
jgi:antitoxin ParD1/3/4